MARNNAREKYCANDIIPRYERFYEKILNASGASAASA
jgi:hypothetical protein